MSRTAKSFRTAQPRLAADASAGVRRRLAVEALITEIDGEQVRDFIMGNPRPALERAFEDGLWRAGFKDSFCKVEGESVQIAFNFEAQSSPALHDLAMKIRRIAGALRPGESCGTISSVRRGNRVAVKFNFEPRRSGMEQFTRYRERQGSASVARQVDNQQISCVIAPGLTPNRAAPEGGAGADGATITVAKFCQPFREHFFSDFCP